MGEALTNEMREAAREFGRSAAGDQPAILGQSFAEMCERALEAAWNVRPNSEAPAPVGVDQRNIADALRSVSADMMNAGVAEGMWREVYNQAVAIEALAAAPAPVEGAKPDLEVVAAIIDPLPWSENWSNMPKTRADRKAASITKAAAILSLFTAPGDEIQKGQEGVPERLTDRCADAGPSPRSLERVMRTLYGFDPVEEQPVDADLRPTGEPGDIPFDALEEGHPLAWGMLKTQAEALLLAARTHDGTEAVHSQAEGDGATSEHPTPALNDEAAQ